MKSKIRASRIPKVPVIMQMEASECGAACLAMILAYYGKWIPIEKIRTDCDVSRDGSTAKNILKAARSYGLAAKGYKLEPDALKEQGVFPCIIHWNLNHFVVLKGFKGDKVYLNDPAYGDYTVSAEVFDKSFTGICLMFDPSEVFVADGSRKSLAAFTKKRLKGDIKELILIILFSIIGVLCGIASSMLGEYYADWIIGDEQTLRLMKFIGVFALLAVSAVFGEWLKAHYLMKIEGKMAIVGSSSYIWKLLHLPMSFFSQRMAGDIQKRQSENESAAFTLIQTIAPIFLSSVMMGVYLFIMLSYSVTLTLIVLLFVILNIGVTMIASKRRLNIIRIIMMEKGKLYSTLATGIDMIESLKASNVEMTWTEIWSRSLTAYNNSSIELTRLDVYLGSLTTLFTSTAKYMIIVFGALFVSRGSLTIGGLTAFLGLMALFLAPVNQIVESGQKLYEMRSQMERIDDVMEYTDDNTSDPTNEEDNEVTENAEKLRGNIKVKGLTFGYSRLKPPIISEIDFEVNVGKSIAIVGASGCGKSSVAKLIAGLYTPWSGEIMIDGKSISDIPKNIFTSSVAIVDQDVSLFEGSIAENIKMWDTSIEDFEMILSAKDAGIHEVIMDRNGEYNSKLTVRGENISGGQRQCVEIARALAADPTIMILDEATNALDANTEYKVINAIKNRGVTCIIIAHRLSTIRDCDEILVLDAGRIKERGTHDELIARGGLYKALVANE